jgi:hypothetical protein
MNKLFFAFLACLTFKSSHGQSYLDGIYIGFEEMCRTLENGKKECYTDPSQPRRKWFRLTHLKITGDSAFADQSPVSIHKKDTLYSSSDGGFYYYTGIVIRKEATIFIDLKFDKCDYCAMPVEANTENKTFPWTKSYSCTLTDQGLLINGIIFLKTSGQESDQ